MEDQSMRKRKEESDCHCRSLRIGRSEAGREWADGIVSCMMDEGGEVARGDEALGLWDEEGALVREGTDDDAVSSVERGCYDVSTAKVEFKGFLEEGFH